MKKKLAVKLAVLMIGITNIFVDTMKFPTSFFLWGEPTLPKKNDK